MTITETLCLFHLRFFSKRIHLLCLSGFSIRIVSKIDMIFYETDTLCLICIRFVNSLRRSGYIVSDFKGEIHDPEQIANRRGLSTIQEGLPAGSPLSVY